MTHSCPMPTLRRNDSHPSSPTLYRPRSDRVIAGVCSGIARRFGIDPTIVRVIFVASLLLPGPQILIYLAGWILIPEESLV